MAKKSGKNIQKLLKKKRLQQLKELQDNPALEPATSSKPQIETTPRKKELPAGEGKPVVKTVVVSAVILLIIFIIAYWGQSSDYLSSFGDWLYESLKLGKTD